MRIAVVSDIHANLTALEAVVDDLRTQAADLVVQGGDVVGGGSSPAEVIDRIRDLQWPGVFGNSDEMLWMPERFAAALRAPQFQRYRDAMLAETIPATIRAIGDDRLHWLRSLPSEFAAHDLAVVHASPGDVWRSPLANASDDELARTFEPLACRRVVYGHIHRPYIRRVGGIAVANSGSVSLSYDGDPRAAYLLVDNGVPAIRRVEYDLEKELRVLEQSAMPHWNWIAKVLKSACFQMPTAA